MSTFASIAVLSKPTELKPDWEFEMEGLKFAVHDGMVELNQEIHDFERFSSALNNVFLLIDSIESNKGKLDEAVYSLVNQNNELAEALGIYTPFNLKSDEGQRQAGFELLMALEEDQNDGEQKPAESNESGDKKPGTEQKEEKGFFARAWDAICRFFKSIGNAIAKAWNAITGNGTSSVDSEVKKLSDTVNNAGPELDEAFQLKYDDIAHQGLKYTSNEMMSAFAALSIIAKDLSSKYKTGSWEEIYAVAKQPSAEFIDEKAVEQLLRAFHYEADDEGNIHASEVKPESQNKCLLDYGIDRNFCQSFEQKFWQPASNDIRTIHKVIGILQKGIDKYSDKATVEKFMDSIVHDKQNVITVAKTNYEKPKRGLGNAFKRAWGGLVSAFSPRAGARIERSGYTTRKEEYTTTKGEEGAKQSGERFKAAMAIGQIQAKLASNTLKISQLALKDVREFVKSVNDCLDSTKNKKGQDSIANQNKYRKEFYANQKNNP